MKEDFKMTLEGTRPEFVECPQAGCSYMTEPFFMKDHLKNEHGIIGQELQTRAAIKTEYRRYGVKWIGDKLDLSHFIKVKGVKLNDQIVYDADPAEGNVTLVNNFLTGTIRMRGKSGGQYPYNYLEFIDKMFGAKTPHRTIEVCSYKVPGIKHGGSCAAVDIRSGPDIPSCFRFDGQTLERLRDNYYERWRCDPPYNEKTAKEMYNCEMPSVHKLLEAGARVCKPGALMFLLYSKQVQSGTIGKGNIKRIGFINISVVPNNETRVLNIYVKLLEPETEESKEMEEELE
jgi:hypothetical protein